MGWRIHVGCDRAYRVVRDGVWRFCPHRRPSWTGDACDPARDADHRRRCGWVAAARQQHGAVEIGGRRHRQGVQGRSEEHTSELQSLMRISYAVFCLKKKKQSTRLHKLASYITKHTPKQT